MARLHEHQGKALLGEAGVGIPRGVVVRTPGEAEQALLDLGGRAVIKIQTLVDAPGEAGGAEEVSTPQAAATASRRLLDLGNQGVPVSELLVEEGTIECYPENGNLVFFVHHRIKMQINPEFLTIPGNLLLN